MKARIVIDVELVDGADLADAVEIAEQAAALLIQHRDRRVESAEPRGVERLPSS